ncbi:hypothetical protein GCM10010121_058510 [Streptomyces brasiliensis]|uniref:Uncharacterized protein n=1 Tax=Streptomyces brasiliensis TaxID=1954 RepID=A0A917L0W3_9ACTN|nr:hypothetical protein GCM10010121_058510 [Streptomyces brasiliensis]
MGRTGLGSGDVQVPLAITSILPDGSTQFLQKDCRNRLQPKHIPEPHYEPVGESRGSASKSFRSPPAAPTTAVGSGRTERYVHLTAKERIFSNPTSATFPTKRHPTQKKRRRNGGSCARGE